MRHKKLIIAVLALALLIGTASAGILTYYGRIVTTATVSQSVLLDGNDYTTPVEDAFTAYGGYCVCREHWLENQGSASVTVDVEHKVNGEVNVPAETGIDIKLLEPVHEEYDTTGEDVVAIIVKEWSCCTATWTVDITSVNEPHGVYGIGLAISLDYISPTFQVWYAEHGPAHDDQDIGWYYAEYDAGWGPAIPIAEIDWVIVNIREPGDQHFEISIDCAHLGGCGATYWWAMQLRTNLMTWLGVYDWGEDVAGFMENHVGMIIAPPIVLGPGETFDFDICYEFDPLIAPGTYTIVTVFS